MRGRSIVAALGLLVGCSSGGYPRSCELPTREWHPATVEIYIDPKFSAVEVGSVYRGMLAWTTATRGIVGWGTHSELPDEIVEYQGKVCTNNYVMVSTTSQSELIKRWDRENSSDPMESSVVLAYTIKTCQLTVTFVVMDRIHDSSTLDHVITHEIGHYFGLKHPDEMKDRTKYEGRAIMNSTVEGGSDCITSVDLKLFCEKMNCNPALLNPCDKDQIGSQ